MKGLSVAILLPSVDKIRQKSTFFNSIRSSVHEMQADYQRPTQVFEHKRLWRRCVASCKQLLILRREGMWRLFSDIWRECTRSGNRGNTWQNVEPDEASPFRAKSFESEYANGPKPPGSGHLCSLLGL